MNLDSTTPLTFDNAYFQNLIEGKDVLTSDQVLFEDPNSRSDGGGPKFQVELGRRDGLISKASMVSGNLPGPNFNLDQLKTMFAKNNLSQIDMIALSGSHTLGFSHCSRFTKRLYSFSNGRQVDPTLNPVYAQDLMKSCPNNISDDNIVFMDPVTPQKFDNAYYQNLVEGKGLFTSDQVLYTDLSSRSTVKDFASNSGQFITEFATAMRRLGRVGVKTGEQGEIRKDCAAFN
ncbi:peroxidase family protein, partial [Striga asiatica]